MDDTRRKQLSWIQAILDQTGWTQTELARQAGIAPATLSKFRKPGDNAATLETVTVDKIAAVAPIPHYERARVSIPAGFEEAEAAEYRAGYFDADINRAVEALKGNNSGIDAWVLASRALENVGYLPGDVLLVDTSKRPRDGDVVCAQVYDRMGGAETAFRLHYSPFLTGASHVLTFARPILLNEHVHVMGVVTASLRPRQTKLAS